MEKLIVDKLEKYLFSNKLLIMSLFLLITVFFLFSIQNLKSDSSFNKLLPLNHKFIQTFVEYQQEFGGANRIIVAVMDKQGNIFNADYLQALKKISDEIFFIKGIKRSQTYSIFTPNVNYTEVVEDGIVGGNVVPDNFNYSESSIKTLKENIYKANIIGKLVANDFSGALVSTQLQEINPDTNKKIDYTEVAIQLEERIRERYKNEYPNVEIHIIGFAKYMGDISDGSKQVIKYFFLTIIILTFLIIYFSQSFLIGIIPILSSVIAVIWQLGLLPIIGYGLDPVSVLVPFLILAIGTSHGIQIISRVKQYLIQDLSLEQSSRKSFRALFIPGLIALLSDTVGFFSILLIDVGIIQEMAITASIGVAIVIVTNLILLPILISFVPINNHYKDSIQNRMSGMQAIWNRFVSLVEIKHSLLILFLSSILLIICLTEALNIKVGDLHEGVPEFHKNSQYNLDSAIISQNFSIGVDVLNVIVETKPEGCIDFDVMQNIEAFTWKMKSIKGVKTVNSLPTQAKRINVGWNEGYLKWNELPRNIALLSQATAYIPTSTGLLNSDCSVMPVHIYTEDHKQETIDNIIAAIEEFKLESSIKEVTYRLATGNVGVMAASNDEVEKSQFPILIYMFSAIMVLVYIGFRSVSAVGIILYPIFFVSIMTYALMSYLEIGLKVNTLPVVALGIGIGVDYGIYLYSRMTEEYKFSNDLYKAYLISLSTTGYSILFTGLALSIGVCTWLFSPLKFQSDMGILLVFMFFVNMLTALLLVPALISISNYFKK